MLRLMKYSDWIIVCVGNYPLPVIAAGENCTVAGSKTWPHNPDEAIARPWSGHLPPR